MIKYDTTMPRDKHQSWANILIEKSNSLILSQNAEESCICKKEC